MEDARKDLAARTDISVDRKSQIITITVTDKSPQRAAAMAQAYVEELNRTLAEVSTSSARRERIFLEGRLQTVNQDLEAAEKDFSQFASKNRRLISRNRARPWSMRRRLSRDNTLPRDQNSKGSGRFTRTATSGCAPRRHALPNWKISS